MRFDTLLSLALVGACSFDGSVPLQDSEDPNGTDAASASDGAVSGDDGAITNDAPVAATDTDGDLILDDDDNCPTVANPNQFDEDGDALGNLCDNCPAESNLDQANSDLDELGDLCDPQPAEANQMLYFEGFDELPNASDWNGLNSWQVDNGSLVQNDNSDRYYLRHDAVDGSNNVLVVAKIQFSNPLGNNGIAFRYGGVFVEANADPDNNGCWLLRSLSQPVEGYSAVSIDNGSPTGTNPVGPDVEDNSDYVIASSVAGTTRSCGFAHAGNTPVSFDYSGPNFNGQGLGIVTSYTEAKVAYFYAIRLQ